jgi:hypothetical protein
MKTKDKPMRKFVLETNSESGDNYTYFISHPTKPSGSDIIKFLAKHATDKDDETVYEQANRITEIKESDFLTIPK